MCTVYTPLCTRYTHNIYSTTYTWYILWVYIVGYMLIYCGNMHIYCGEHAVFPTTYTHQKYNATHNIYPQYIHPTTYTSHNIYNVIHNIYMALQIGPFGKRYMLLWVHVYHVGADLYVVWVSSGVLYLVGNISCGEHILWVTMMYMLWVYVVGNIQRNYILWVRISCGDTLSTRYTSCYPQDIPDCICCGYILWVTSGFADVLELNQVIASPIHEYGEC